MIHTFKQLFGSTPHPVMLPEGVDDPGVLKCVFMAGGPPGRLIQREHWMAAEKGRGRDFTFHADVGSYSPLNSI